MYKLQNPLNLVACIYHVQIQEGSTIIVLMYIALVQFVH